MNYGSGDLPAIPTMLIQAFPLEAYLRNLNNYLDDQLSVLKNTLSSVHDETKSSTTLLNQIRTFMRHQTLMSLQEKADESGTTLPEGMGLEELLPDFLREDFIGGGAVEVNRNSGKQVLQACESSRAIQDFIGRINKERVQRFRRDEEAEKRIQKQNEEARKRLEEMCEKLEDSQRRHADDLNRVTQWLRPVQVNDENGVSSAANSNTNANSFNSTNRESYWWQRDEAAEMRRELNEALRGAPLFVEFRQILLRDLTDRLESAKDEQVMALGSTVAALKEELRRELQRRNTANTGSNNPNEYRSDVTETDSRNGGVIGTISTSAVESERRLRSLDRNYIQRGEIVASLRDKADAAIVAQKADESYVRDLEQRLLSRIADLEERMSLYEAERIEFRRILRAVVDNHQYRHTGAQNGSNSSRGHNNNNVNNNTTTGVQMTGTQSSLLVVEDAADPRRRPRFSESPNTSELRPSRRTPSPQGTKKNSHSPSHVSGRPYSSRQMQEFEEDQQLQSEFMGTGAAVNPSSSSGRLAVGMTVNQEAYANYVTNELNRRAVESLPPLPYERTRRQ